jgi:hypothetical protein
MYERGNRLLLLLQQLASQNVPQNGRNWVELNGRYKKGEECCQHWLEVPLLHTNSTWPDRAWQVLYKLRHFATTLSVYGLCSC